MWQAESGGKGKERNFCIIIRRGGVTSHYASCIGCCLFAAKEMSMLGAFSAVLSGHTSSLIFAFRNRPTFSMDHCQPPPFKLKQYHHNTRLTCQAPRDDELPVPAPSKKTAGSQRDEELPEVDAPSSKKTLRDDELPVHGPTETAVTPRVGIIMHSDSDLPFMRSAAKILEMFDVPYELELASPHVDAKEVMSYAMSAHDRGIKIVIVGAPDATYLPASGMIADLTSLLVIVVPVGASLLDRTNAFLSIVKGLKNAPVGVFVVNNATNAGLMAVRILGLGDNNLQLRMIQYLENEAM